MGRRGGRSGVVFRGCWVWILFPVSRTPRTQRYPIFQGLSTSETSFPPLWASGGTKNVENLGHRGHVSPQAFLDPTDTPPLPHPHPLGQLFSVKQYLGAATTFRGHRLLKEMWCLPVKAGRGTGGLVRGQIKRVEAGKGSRQQVFSKMASGNSRRVPSHPQASPPAESWLGSSFIPSTALPLCQALG